MYQVLEETIAHYDEVMNKMQEKLDLTVAESVINERRVKLVQHKFEDVESRYIDMCAEKKLTQIMRNMKMADEKKQHKAAKTIQVSNDDWIVQTYSHQVVVIIINYFRNVGGVTRFGRERERDGRPEEGKRRAKGLLHLAVEKRKRLRKVKIHRHHRKNQKNSLLYLFNIN